MCAQYPYNLDFDYGALEKLVHYSINNLGDPFIESNYGVHSREFEVGLGLTGSCRPGDPDETAFRSLAMGAAHWRGQLCYAVIEIAMNGSLKLFVGLGMLVLGHMQSLNGSMHARTR